MATQRPGATMLTDWSGMEVSIVLERQRQRLLQIGMGLLVYSSLVGFAIPYLGSPRIGLSVHTLSAYQGVLLLTQGFSWTRLKHQDEHHAIPLVHRSYPATRAFR